MRKKNFICKWGKIYFLSYNFRKEFFHLEGYAKLYFLICIIPYIYKNLIRILKGIVLPFIIIIIIWFKLFLLNQILKLSYSLVIKIPNVKNKYSNIK